MRTRSSLPPAFPPLLVSLLLLLLLSFAFYAYLHPTSCCVSGSTQLQSSTPPHPIFIEMHAYNYSYMLALLLSCCLWQMVFSQIEHENVACCQSFVGVVAVANHVFFGLETYGWMTGSKMH